ncbi:hypothetical protein ACB098_05G102300 [Castanea mollissima]
MKYITNSYKKKEKTKKDFPLYLGSSGVSSVLPNINKLVPTGTGDQAFDEHAHVEPDRELRVVTVLPNARVLHHVIPRAHGHVIRARHQEAPIVRREFHLPDGVAMAVEHRQRGSVSPNVPNPNRLVNRRRGNDAIVVLVPVARQNLKLVSRDHHRRAGLAHVPHAQRAVAGGGGEDVGVAGVPDGGVNAVGMLLEASDGGGAIESPELNGVVPGGGDEGVAADGVVVDGLDLARVFLEGADRVGGGGKREVVDLERAVGYGGDEERVVGLGPGDVVDAVGGVEGGELYERGGRSGREVEDVDAAVAEDAEVLGGGYGEAGLVEWAEFYGVSVEWGFEDGHGCCV